MKKQKFALSKLAKVIITINAISLAVYIFGEIFREEASFGMMSYVYFAFVFVPINLLSGFELSYNRDKILLPYVLAIVPLQFLVQLTSFGVRDFLWHNLKYQIMALLISMIFGRLLATKRKLN